MKFTKLETAADFNKIYYPIPPIPEFYEWVRLAIRKTDDSTDTPTEIIIWISQRVELLHHRPSVDTWRKTQIQEWEISWYTPIIHPSSSYFFVKLESGEFKLVSGKPTEMNRTYFFDEATMTRIGDGAIVPNFRCTSAWIEVPGDEDTLFMQVDDADLISTFAAN